METILQLLPLLNAIFLIFLKPLYELITNQKKEIEELKRTNEELKKEVGLLRELMYAIVPPEILKQHLKDHSKG